jgi:hypothetical protein
MVDSFFEADHDPATPVKTLRSTVRATFSNLEARRGFQLCTYDLTPFKGQTIKFCVSSREDVGSVTFFVVDDFKLVSE